MVTLKDVSINNSINAPKNNGGNRYAKNSEFGIKNMANAETIAPTK
jgi:hypothetical protein